MKWKQSWSLKMKITPNTKVLFSFQRLILYIFCNWKSVINNGILHLNCMNHLKKYKTKRRLTATKKITSNYNYSNLTKLFQFGWKFSHVQLFLQILHFSVKIYFCLQNSLTKRKRILFFGRLQKSPRALLCLGKKEKDMEFGNCLNDGRK